MTLESYPEFDVTITKTSSEPSHLSKSIQNPQLTILEDALSRVQHLFASKNAEYGDGGDILANFRRLADQQGVPMSSAWFFLAGKHLDVVTQYVKDYREGASRSRTQAVSERVADIIVYSLLLLVILDEEGRL